MTTSQVYDATLWSVSLYDAEGRPLTQSFLVAFPATGPEEYLQLDATILPRFERVTGLYKLHWKQDNMNEALYKRLQQTTAQDNAVEEVAVAAP
jgi:hypothetical protein